MDNIDKILTCVYCGKAYPVGTPSHGSKVLTDHIKVCEKHPLRAAEATIEKLRSALVGIIGGSTREELEQMELQVRVASAPEGEKVSAMNAIHALLYLDGLDGCGELPGSEVWKNADNPPVTKPGCWSDDVVVFTNFGDVFMNRYFGDAETGTWQRPMRFNEGEMVKWWTEGPNT